MAQTRDPAHYPQQHQKEHHEAADVHHGPGGVPHGGDQGRDKGGTGRDRAGTFRRFRRLPGQGQGYDQRRQNMHPPQQHPGPEAAEAAQPRHPQDKRRAAVVGKQQQAAGLPPGDAAPAIQLGHGAGPHGIAARKAQEKGPGSGPAAPQQPGQRTQSRGRPGVQRRQQARHRQKRKQRRDHRPGAQGQPIPDGLGRFRRPGQQQPKGRQASPGRQLSLHIPHLHGHCMRPGGGTCKFFRRRA